MWPGMKMNKNYLFTEHLKYAPAICVLTAQSSIIDVNY
jgi:hypothetical protein